MILDGLLWIVARAFPKVAHRPWLDVPTGEGPIGPEWPRRWAAARGSTLARDPEGGLIRDLSSLARAERIDPRIRTFYEHTARYPMRVEPRWRAGFGWAGRAWVSVFARRWGQFNLPTSADAPLSNEIYASGPPDPCQWWVRRYPDDRALYVSRYDVVSVDGEPDPCVRITFPVPGGAWVVLFRVALDGSTLVLTEDGGMSGGPGLYLVPRGGTARYVASFREEIRVLTTETGCRAEHRMWFFGLRVVTLAYDLGSGTSDRGTAK